MIKSPVKPLISALLFTLFCYGNIVQAATCLISTDEHNITLCTTLANQGDAKAQNTLGEIYYQDALLIKGYHTKARMLFEQAAARGLAQAQYNLGAIYRDEFNHFPTALSWFEKAAAQGNLDAMNSIGYIYENGFGGESPRLYIFDENGKNIDPDLPFIEAKYAAYEFGLPVKTYPREIYPMSEYGQGVESDVSLAVSWYQKAAAQGHALAQTNLAYFYLMGIAVDKDEQQAFTLYQRAAEQDFAPALRSLAFMYMQGLGTKQDIPKAFAALEQAYRLQPDNNMWKLINIGMNNRYQLKTTVEKHSNRYRNQFEYEDSSNEDHLIERFKFFNKIYQLDFSSANGLTALFVWMRPTVGILLGESVGENSIFKERYFIKESIQGYHGTMQFLSYYYKGEKLDIERAQLWRKYAIQMGANPDEDDWSKYPPLTE